MHPNSVVHSRTVPVLYKYRPFKNIICTKATFESLQIQKLYCLNSLKYLLMAQTYHRSITNFSYLRIHMSCSYR